MDLGTGKRDLIISIADVVKIPCATLSMENRKHYFNHLLFNPDGSRFVFLHRSIDRNGQRGFNTRAITADPDGRNRYVVNDSGMWSHFIWRDPQHLLSWSRNSARGDAMYLNQDRTDSLAVVANGAIAHDSHVSYLPDGQWLVCDGYPRGANREQPLFLCHAETGEKVDLGAYPSPQPYQGEWRCDLHPRFSRDGRTLCIDSAHEGKGRQLYLIDLN
jgi:Tol biopolymer transport system component